MNSILKNNMSSTILLFFIAITSCTKETSPEESKKQYSVLLQEIATEKEVLKAKYAHATHKETVIEETRKYIFNTISKDIFPNWYGTQWDFNGTTRTPKNGKIACGYFITNILTDVGFKIPRIKWAQSASEVFIKKLSPKIKRFSNTSISDIEKHLLSSGEGIYIVGLDTHTGFIVVENNNIQFVHANYYQPKIGVMSQDITSKNPLRDSKYRVIGKLLSHEMVVNWLEENSYH